MYIYPVRLLIIVLILILQPQVKSFNQYRIEGFAQGTTYRITYYAADSLLSRAEVEHIFEQLDSSLSLYKPYSIINAFNKSANGIAIDEHLKNVVTRSLEVFTATGGAFDITVGLLVSAWGFGPKKIDSMPSANLIDSIMKCVGSGKLKLEEGKLKIKPCCIDDKRLQFTGAILSKQLACISIDVNGIAQGYSVDVLSNVLERKGINNYMVEIGGEIRMKGRRQPGNEQMKIGVESPAGNPFTAPQLKTIPMPDSGAVTTSGSYQRFYESNGKRITHIIDPRTGKSVENNLLSVTVFANDAITADAYDNALMVMGLENGLLFAQRNKIDAYFIYRRRDGVLKDTATEGFYKLMRASARSVRAD